jgi:cellulose synthase/poly-beta-1,6-N-acetylglucosamine synthase-like glycosyltransferase
MNYIFESTIILMLSLYFAYGASQLVTARKIKREANQMNFPKKHDLVSVIIPIRSIFRTTKENLKSVCVQEYPNYEVIFVAEVAEHDAVSVALALSKKYPNVRVLFSGKHDPAKCIAKCHNLVYAVKHARGDVFLFGDSDVTFSRDWIKKMTYPLSEYVGNKRIDATTASFFMDTDTIKGKLITLPISTVTFTTSYTHENQRFPTYASGASIAVSRKVYDDLNISKIWENSFNDDLVFANKIASSGYNLYNQHALLNHPNEVFSDLKQSINKLIRWTFTVYTFGNKNLKGETPSMFAKNQQFQLSMVLALSLFLLGFSDSFILMILTFGYLYSVFYRLAVGVIIEEKGMILYYIFSPIMTMVLIIFHINVRLRSRGFSWEGVKYTL